MVLNELLKEHNVNLKEENVIFSFEGGILELSLEDGTLSVSVQTVDRVIVCPGITIDEIAEKLIK